jgi:hypothetical protein
MITFTSFRLLIEDRVQWLKDNAGPIDTSHDTFAKHKDTPSIIDHFAQADPSKKKVHTQWILNQYKKGNIRQEDSGRVKETLSNFDKYKGKLEKKDINQYKHISHVDQALEPHLGTASSNREADRQVKHEGATLVHDQDGIKVHQLHTKEAACHYGAGTKWCTAAKKDNMFDEYHKEGPLHVVHTPDGRKYQFHFASDQYADEQDVMQDTKHLTNQYPGLRKVQAFKGKSPDFDTDEEYNKEVATKEKPYEGTLNHPGNSIQHDLPRHNDDEATHQYRLKPDTLRSYYHNNMGAYYRPLLRHPNTPPDVLHDIWKTHSAYSNRATEVASHPNLSDETKHEIIHATNSTGGPKHHAAWEQLATNPSLSHEHMRQLYHKASTPGPRGHASNLDAVETIAHQKHTPNDVLHHIANRSGEQEYSNASYFAAGTLKKKGEPIKGF